MSDYSASMAAITGRIATIQSRFGIRPPISASASSQASTASQAAGSMDGATSSDTSAFSSMVDRLLAKATQDQSNNDSTSITDLLAAQIERQNGLTSLDNSPFAGTAAVATQSPAITQVGVVAGGDGDPATGETIVRLATQYLGVPYVWGGEDPTGFDCSGLVQHVFEEVGINLPRVSRDQARAGTPVASLDEAVPGDLIAFGDPVDHIGIYAGDGKMVVAPHTGDVVKIQDITRTPVAIRRILSVGGDPSSSGISGISGSVDGTDTGRPNDDPAATFRPLFQEAAEKYGISAELLEAVAKQESRFNENAVSPAGAQGLMQIMPATANALRINAFDPAQAVDGSARLLSQHLRRFGSIPLALAAYNAGPGAVQKYGGIPPYRETQGYVSKIMADLERRTSAAAPVSFYSQPTSPAPADRGQTNLPKEVAAKAAPVANIAPVVSSPIVPATSTEPIDIVAAAKAQAEANTSRVASTPATTAAGPTPTTANPTNPTTTTQAPTTPAKPATVATTTPATGATSSVVATPRSQTPPSVVAKIVWPTGPSVSPAAGAWGPNTQTQVSSVGGEGTVSWGAAGLLTLASPEEIQAILPGATGPIAKGVLRNLQFATPTQMRSREFRQTINDVNRDALGMPNAPDVIPVDPPAAPTPPANAPSATAPATAGTLASPAGPATTSAPTPASTSAPTPGQPVATVPVAPATATPTASGTTANPPIARILTGPAATPPSVRV